MIPILSPNSYWVNLLQNQTIGEAEPKVMDPEEGEIINIVRSKVYDYKNSDRSGFDCLEVDIKVNVGEEGYYNFNFMLYSKDDELITPFGDLWGFPHSNIPTEKKLAKGINVVPIYFPGTHIRNKKVNGPYKVAVDMQRIYVNIDKKKNSMTILKRIPLDKKNLYTSYFKYSQFTKGYPD